MINKGDKVIITMGCDKGLIGTYQGLMLNSAWHVITDSGNRFYYVNPEEFEKYNEGESSEDRK